MPHTGYQIYSAILVAMSLVFISGLLLIIITDAYQPGLDASSLYRDRYRKGDDTVERYVASSFNDSVNTREFNGTREYGGAVATADLANDVAVGQLDASRSADEERDFYANTRRYEAYLEANRFHHNLDTGDVLERNDNFLGPDRAKQRRVLVERRHNDVLEHDDALRQQNKTTSEFGSSRERFRAARVDETRQSRAAIAPDAASGIDRATRDAAVDEAMINTRTRFNYSELERGTGQAWADRLHYNVDESDVIL